MVDCEFAAYFIAECMIDAAEEGQAEEGPEQHPENKCVALLGRIRGPERPSPEPPCCSVGHGILLRSYEYGKHVPSFVITPP